MRFLLLLSIKNKKMKEKILNILNIKLMKKTATENL